MSSNRVPPPFPQPFVSTGTASPAQNAAGTPEQRPIGSTQGSAYPPDPTPRNTPTHMPPPYIPSRHPSAPIPANQFVQQSVGTPPAFPVPQVQAPRVPTTPSGPPPPMVQRNETTHFSSHFYNTQVTSGPHANYSSPAPPMSHAPSQRGSGTLGAAQFSPPINRVFIPQSLIYTYSERLTA